MTIFLLLAVVAGTADLPAAEERPVEGAATPMRDVIAAAFDAPFATDTEIDILIADDNARVISEGGPTLFRYRRIWAVQVAGAKDQPIVVRPQTPGGVTFRRDTRLTLRGKWIELRGFQFEHCGPDISLGGATGASGGVRSFGPTACFPYFPSVEAKRPSRSAPRMVLSFAVDSASTEEAIVGRIPLSAAADSTSARTPRCTALTSVHRAQDTDNMKTTKSRFVGLPTAILIFVLLPEHVVGDVVVGNSEELVAAVRDQPADSTIKIAAGTYELTAPQF